MAAEWSVALLLGLLLGLGAGLPTSMVHPPGWLAGAVLLASIMGLATGRRLRPHLGADRACYAGAAIVLPAGVVALARVALGSHGERPACSS